jgi:hypothetical protein
LWFANFMYQDEGCSKEIYLSLLAMKFIHCSFDGLSIARKNISGFEKGRWLEMLLLVECVYW